LKYRYRIGSVLSCIGGTLVSSDCYFYLDPGYVIPSAVHVMDIVRRRFAIAKDKSEGILIQNMQSPCTDIWTSFSNDAYIFLTLHFTDNSLELKSYKLATYPFPEQHTDNNIVDKLFMTKALIFNERLCFSWREKWKIVRCAAHCLHLGVIEGFRNNTIAQSFKCS